MAENDIIVPKENAAGGFDEVALAAADIGAAPSTGISPSAITGTAVVDSDARLTDARTPTAHSSTHHTGGSDPLTPANIGAAPAVNVIELTADGTTTITTAQLPARGIAYIEGGASFTVNLPTPDKRQSGLSFSIKTEHEGGVTGNVFITVVHDAVNLLTAYELDEDAGSIDFRWDGYRWTYSFSEALVVRNANDTFTSLLPLGTANRNISLPDASGTIALTAQLTDTQIFTANGTWTKPAGAKLVHYLLIGGGGGGGSGRRSAAGNSLGGGGGGAGGGLTTGFVDPAFLGATETITVGAGGDGGPNQGNDTTGANGTAGGDSSLGSFVKAKGGAAGGGGSFGAGAAGAATTLASLFYGTNSSTQAGGIGSPNSSTAGATAAASLFLPSGGGGGGSRHSNVNTLGGKGGDIGQTNTGVTSAPAIASDTNGPAGIRSQSSWSGTGGGGGSNGTDTGFQGGNGGLYGGGGGGGSGAINTTGGNNKGGDGGAGIVIVTTYF